MMKIVGLILLIILSMTVCAQSQADVIKVVDTEKAFAKLAEEKGTKAAFLANLSADAVLFLPDKVNAKEYWSTRPGSASLLSWAPNFAEISADGKIGYTTGNWEYRSKGKGDQPVAFGEFITIWMRQPNGEYKFVIDIGIGHDKREVFSTEWSTSSQSAKVTNKTKPKRSLAESVDKFLSVVTSEDPVRAYKAFASDEIRLFREGKFPFIAKPEAVKAVTQEKGRLVMSRPAGSSGTADLDYVLGTYSRTDDGKVVEKGNYMQIWKVEKGAWRIVLDIFKPVP